MKIKETIPSEDIEWQMLANWLRSQWYKFSHIANEIGIAGHVGMLINKKKVKLWLNKWFPDYCIILKRWALLFIELKRKRTIKQNWEPWASPSKVSDEQLDWVSQLSKLDNVDCQICYWHKECIELINLLENK